MNNPLVVSLAITAAGMGLLFLALAFFYGLLSLISSILQDEARPGTLAETVALGTPDRPAPPAGVEPMLQAAAIAVALARAEAESRPGLAPAGPAAQPLSPWWISHQAHRTAAGSSPWRTL